MYSCVIFVICTRAGSLFDAMRSHYDLNKSYYKEESLDVQTMIKVEIPTVRRCWSLEEIP